MSSAIIVSFQQLCSYHTLQVWGIGSEDRRLYFRHGVTPTEVTGQAWVPVCAQVDNSHTTNKPR